MSAFHTFFLLYIYEGDELGEIHAMFAFGLSGMLQTSDNTKVFITRLYDPGK